MAMHWKSSKGYINVKQMEDSHLANAWSTILRKIEDNSRLPKSLVETAGLDKYDEEPLNELAEGFQNEWERRLKERVAARVEATYINKRGYNNIKPARAVDDLLYPEYHNPDYSPY
jgi:hypothetical protein